jgi:hypothetical protein
MAFPAPLHPHLHTTASLQCLARASKSHYQDYAYCTLADIRKQPKNARIQMGVVITSKPTVGTGEMAQRLTWTVADKTGTVSRCPSRLIFLASEPSADVLVGSIGKLLLPIQKRLQPIYMGLGPLSPAR